MTNWNLKCNSLEQELAQALQSKRKCQRRLSYFKCKQAGDVLGEMGRIEEQLDECYRRIKQLTSENMKLQERVLFGKCRNRDISRRQVGCFPSRDGCCKVNCSCDSCLCEYRRGTKEKREPKTSIAPIKKKEK